MYGLIGSLLAVGAACAIAFGIGWQYGGKGPKADLARLEARVAKDDAARTAALAERRAEDARANDRIREAQAAAARDLADANARAADAGKRAAALAAKLRATPAGGCLLPPDARRLFDDAARSSGVAAPGLAAAPDRGAAAPGTVAGQAAPADAVAAPERDAAPVDCVTAWEVGARNTARATFNADALDACNAQLVGYWQACTGRTLGGIAP